MTGFKIRGFGDLFSIGFIIVCLIVGAGIAYKSKKPDSAPEQAVEAVLRTQGIDIDFSPENEE